MSHLIPYRHNRGLSGFARGGLFDDRFFRNFFDVGDWLGSSAFRVDVKDRKDHYELEAELPGVKQDQIAVTLDNDVLTIAADMNVEKKEERDSYVYSERRMGHFQRSFNVENIDQDKISAKYEDGVLHLTLPKKDAAPDKPGRRIDIS